MPLSVWLELWLLSFELCEQNPIITRTFQQLCKIQKDLHMCVQNVEQPKAEKVFSFFFGNIFLHEDICLTRQDFLFLKYKMCTIFACFFSSLKNQNKSILPYVKHQTVRDFQKAEALIQCYNDIALHKFTGLPCHPWNDRKPIPPRRDSSVIDFMLVKVCPQGTHKFTNHSHMWGITSVSWIPGGKGGGGYILHV